MNALRVGNRWVGPGQPCFIIAEIGVNHNGDPALAHRLVQTAADLGADAVKFQKRTVDDILVRSALERVYDSPTALGRTYGEHRRRLELADTVYTALAAAARDRDVIFLASVWDAGSADFLERLDASAFKIASADLTNLPLLEHVGAKGRPVFLSTGMSSLEEIDAAVATLRRFHAEIVLMHCVSTYPSEFDQVNLRCLTMLSDRYGLPVGYSGHERGIAVSEAAVAVGAVAVERHFTIDRTLPGPDHAASLEPPGLTRLIRDIRAIERALGRDDKRVLPEEISIRARLAKSVVSAVPIPRGAALRREHLTIKGPGTGFKPSALPILVGSAAQEDIPADVVIQPEMVRLEGVRLGEYLHPRSPT